MFHYPINYDEPLFRPPSEGNSLIIQVTLGCSWNKCAFCEMYTSKKFTVRNEIDIFEEIEAFAPYAQQIKKVFLADGDPLVLSTPRLLRILEKLRNTFPNLRRISTYASPNNINNKTNKDLKSLKNAGLTLLYVGIESGDNEVLEAIQKGETFDSTVAGLNKAKKSGIDCSVMIIIGVGGKLFSKQHAVNSAKILNATQTKFASTLVLTAYKGVEHYKNRYKGNFVELSTSELFKEMRVFMENLVLDETIFRSDHTSNSVVLKGILGRDKQKFMLQIDDAILHPNGENVRIRNGGF